MKKMFLYLMLMLVACADGVHAATTMSGVGVSTTGYVKADSTGYVGGTMGVGVPSPATKLDVSGTLRFSNGGEACDTVRKGAIKYVSNDFYVCRNGTAWESLTSITASSAGGMTSTLTDSRVAGDTASTSTSDTFTNVNLGTASAGRYVLVVVGGSWVNAGSAFTVSTLTIGGVAAKKLYDVGRAHRGISFWLLRVPTGTTADIALTYVSLTNFRSIAVYSVTGIQQGLMASGEATLSGVTHSLSIAPTNSNSIAFYGAVCGGVQQTNMSWGNATKDFDQVNATSVYYAFSYARTPLTYFDTYTATQSWNSACTYTTMAGISLM